MTRLEENLGAVDVELTPNELREMGEAVSKIHLEGARLPQAALDMTGH
jgi:aryl-alcohol dehydrogenase-like predicted oxidoreductase